MLAHSFFNGVGVGEGGGSHIGKGLSWYIGPVLHDLLRRESDLWVVRAEACEHDLEGAIRWLRGDDTLDVLRAAWKSTSELGYCGDLRGPPRHRAAAATGTTSRRWRRISTHSFAQTQRYRFDEGALAGEIRTFAPPRIAGSVGPS